MKSSLLSMLALILITGCVSQTEQTSNSDHWGMLEIISRGYKTSIRINGIEQGLVKDSIVGARIKGKLNSGNNTIGINVSRLENKSTYRPVVVTLFLVDENKKYKKGFTVDWGENEEYEKLYEFVPNDLFEGAIEEKFFMKER